ncbi:MAG: hypothetical protein K0M56_08100 [Kaistella sp.]|nr:hypothetical protein [Kaistella sp.]
MGRISDILGYQSPFQEGTIGDKPSSWKGKLEKLLSDNKVSKFYYQNHVPLESGFNGIEIFCAENNGTFFYQFKPIVGIPSLSNSDNIQSTFLFLNKILKIEFNTDLKYLSESVELLDQFGTQQIRTLLTNQRSELSEYEYEQLYYEFKKLGLKSDGSLKKEHIDTFNEATKIIEEKLKNQFYKNKICITHNLVNEVGEVIVSKNYSTKNSDNGPCEVEIKMSQFPNEKIKQETKINPNLYKDKVKKVQEEANARGLNVDVEKLRKQQIAELENQINQYNWLEIKWQQTEAYFDETIGAFVESVQVIQKVGENVWKDGETPQSLWYSKNSEYSEWPQFAQMNPAVNGVTDGVIDEIVGIPMAIKSCYQLVTDKEKREAFSKIFTKDGFNQMVDGVKQEAEETLDDSEKLSHFTSKTTVGVVSTFLGVGLFTKVGKIDDLIGTVEDGIKLGNKFVNPGTLNKLEELKKLARHLDNDKEIDKLVKEFGEADFEDRLDEVIDFAKRSKKQQREIDWQKVRKLFIRGNKFNKKLKDLWPPKYKFHEVTIEHPTLKYTSGPNKGKPVRFRLDSYDPDIISRKATDLDNIQIDTFSSYISELKKKYPVGAKIVAQDPDIRGHQLIGNLKLEIPSSNLKSKKLLEFLEYDKVTKKYYSKIDKNIEVLFHPE